MKQHKQQRQGFVLIVVLWVLATLMVITLGMAERVMLDHRAAMYAMDQTQAMMMARAACARGTVALRNKAYEDSMELYRLRSSGRGESNWTPTEHRGQEWAQFTEIHEDAEFFEFLPPMDNDFVAYKIVDAERFINLNSASMEMLEAVGGLKRPTLRKISVRRTQETHKGEGVSRFQAVEELRYMDGVDDEEWFGEGKNPGLKDIFTVYGSGQQINVNTASRDVLLSIPELDEAVVERILLHRNGPDGELGTDDDKPFYGMDDLREKAGAQDENGTILSKYCIFRSYHFIIRGMATLQGGKVRAACTSVVQLEGFMVNEIAYKEEIFGT